MINVPSDDTALPEMLTHALLYMPTCEADIAGVTSRTVYLVTNVHMWCCYWTLAVSPHCV